MSSTILITGAGSGLGRSLCRYFAERGNSLLITDLDLDAAEETLGLLPSAEQSEVHPLDVTRDEDVAALMHRLAGRRVDILVNNAGLQHVSPLEEFDPGRWAHLVDVLLNGAARMTRALLPRMRAAGFGRVVNIGSIHALVASPYKSAYVAAKHGLLGLAKTVALETADVDITINTICPSYIRTPLVDKQIAQQAAAHGIPEQQVIEQIMLQPMPKKVFITGEEVAATIEFLASSGARNITGQSIAIDGGWTVR